jgi:hypothetical protein
MGKIENKGKLDFWLTICHPGLPGALSLINNQNVVFVYVCLCPVSYSIEIWGWNTLTAL